MPRRYPRAALHLNLAEEQIAKARALMADGENERADFMALRASNDAELALAIARDNAARNSRGSSKRRTWSGQSRGEVQKWV